MSKIKVNLNCPIVTGKQISFMAPCSSADMEGLILNGVEYTVVDSDGVSVAGVHNVWNSGAIVAVIVNVDTRVAFIQNANTNPYIEGQFLPQTQKLEENDDLKPDDSMPFYSTQSGENHQISLKKLKEFMGVQSMVINVTTCIGAEVVCTDGVTTLTNTGSCKFYVPNGGLWKVTATLDGREAYHSVNVIKAEQYNIDLRILDRVELTTPPDVTTYYVGEQFNPTGAVFTAVFADGTTQDVTDECEFRPEVLNGDTTSVRAVYFHAGWGEHADIEVTVRVLAGISVTTMPNKTEYAYGTPFDPEGMVVTAEYTDGSTRVVEGWTHEPTGALTLDDSIITIYYEEAGYPVATRLPVTVNILPISISVTTPPSRTIYFEGDTFDRSGMVVTAIMSDGSSKIVDDYSVTPSVITLNTDSVKLSYTENGVTVYCTYSIIVDTVKSKLNDNDWSTISAVSDSGQAANYWSVGDTKSLKIKGTVSGYNVDITMDAVIIGIDHNSSREGSNRIHFQLGKINGRDYGLPIGDMTTGWKMNSTNTNTGGWKSSLGRLSVLGNSATPVSPVDGSLMAALPSDLRVVMKSVVKYTDNTGNYSNNSSNVTATTDYLFNLAEFELHGKRTYANEYESNYQLQYDYYKAGNSKIRYTQYDPAGPVYSGISAWYCRSPRYNDSLSFSATNTNGECYYMGASNENAFAPAFCV